MPPVNRQTFPAWRGCAEGAGKVQRAAPVEPSAPDARTSGVSRPAQSSPKPNVFWVVAGAGSRGESGARALTGMGARGVTGTGARSVAGMGARGVTWGIPITRAPARMPRVESRPGHNEGSRGETPVERSEPARRDLEWEQGLPGRLQARDESALAEVYDRLANLLYGLAERICGPHDAQEVVQDAMMKLWRDPRLFDPARGSLAGFLVVLTRHAALDRTRRRRPERPLEDEEGAPLPIPHPGAGPLDAAETAWLGEHVRAALAVLSQAQRRTVERAYFGGETREEIATAMRVPVGTVKSRLKYALDALRAALGELR